MYAGKQYKTNTSRVFQQMESKNRQLVRMRDCRDIWGTSGTFLPSNKNVIQCVKTIAIESAIGNQHIFFDAIRADRRKRQIESNNTGIIPPLDITLVDRFSGLNGSGIPASVPPMGANQLAIGELLLIVSHGARYIPFFALKTPALLANELYFSGIFPMGYNGEIYLDGCHTGEPGLGGHLGDGSSYVERFQQALINLSVAHGGVGINPLLGGFTVKGNLGAAVTHHQPGNVSNGTELIEMDARTTGLIAANLANPRFAGRIPYLTNGNHDFPVTANNPHYRRGATAKVVY